MDEQLKAEIEQCLGNVFDKKTDPAFDDDEPSDDGVVLDSLKAVECLIAVEELVDQKLPAKLVQKGGYETKEEYIEHLTESIAAHLSESGS